MARQLTDKQIAFAKEYVRNGGIGSQAYRYAYNAGKMKAETIATKACILLKNDNIRAIVDQLKGEVTKIAIDKFEWTVESRVKMLYDVAVTCSMTVEDENGRGKMQNPAAVISAIDQVNKMTGDHAAIKQKIEAEINATVELPTHIELIAPEL